MSKQAKGFTKQQSSYVLSVLQHKSPLWVRFGNGSLPKWQMKACQAYINDIVTEEADKNFMDQLRVEDEDERLFTEYAAYSQVGNVYCKAYYYRSAEHGPSLPKLFHPAVYPDTNTCPHIPPPNRCNEERCQLRYKPAYFNLSYTSRQLRQWIGESAVLEVYHPTDGWTRAKITKKLLMTRTSNIVILRAKDNSRRGKHSNANHIGLQELVRQMEILGGFPRRDVQPDTAPPDVDLALKPFHMTAETYAAYLC